MSQALIFAFFLVFVRCSALMLSSPIFGSSTTPLPIRIFTTMVISGALTAVIQPHIGPMPTDLYGLAATVLHEAVAGLIIGMVTTLALQAAQIAGAFLDIQIGLGSSQILNPATGIPSTLISQFKAMLGLIVYLSANGHHELLRTFVGSYQAMPLGMDSVSVLQSGLVNLVTQICLIGLQIAAPVIAVSIIVDAGLGIISRAVPQMPVMLVGAPAKIGIGLLTLAFALPALTFGVTSSISLASDTLHKVFR